MTAEAPGDETYQVYIAWGQDEVQNAAQLGRTPEDIVKSAVNLIKRNCPHRLGCPLRVAFNSADTLGALAVCEIGANGPAAVQREVANAFHRLR